MDSYFQMNGSYASTEVFDRLRGLRVTSVFDGRGYCLETQKGAEVATFLSKRGIPFSQITSQEFRSASELAALACAHFF